MQIKEIEKTLKEQPLIKDIIKNYIELKDQKDKDYIKNYIMHLRKLEKN